MSDCLFCKIAAGQIPSTKVYEDEQVLAFRDIAPQAPVHVLIVPKKHMANILELAGDDTGIANAVVNAVKIIAEQEGVAESGFRVVTNCGPDACQSVSHLHFHILGGRQMADQMA